MKITFAATLDIAISSLRELVGDDDATDADVVQVFGEELTERYSRFPVSFTWIESSADGASITIWSDDNNLVHEIMQEYGTDDAYYTYGLVSLVVPDDFDPTTI